jgi:hypothetical protein
MPELNRFSDYDYDNDNDDDNEPAQPTVVQPRADQSPPSSAA